MFCLKCLLRGRRIARKTLNFSVIGSTPIPAVNEDFMQYNDWMTLLDANPQDWDLRLIYADWCEENDYNNIAILQRWLSQNRKCPGPGCVLEAAINEASWFNAEQEGNRWTFPESVKTFGFVDPHWCLPHPFFILLHDYIKIGRIDGGFHNRFAKSWSSRREAESALVNIVVAFNKNNNLFLRNIMLNKCISGKTI